MKAKAKNRQEANKFKGVKNASHPVSPG